MTNDKTKKVKVDLQCPYCGHCQNMRVAAYRKAVTCHMCNQPVFLAYATGEEGELDENGYYFHAYDPFNSRVYNKELKEMFREGGE